MASFEISGYYVVRQLMEIYQRYWYTDWTDPVAYSGTKTFTIDLKQAYKLDKFEYYNDGTAQIKDHEIQVSRDGVNFKTVEKSVWVKPSTGTFNVFVDLNGEIARYVRIISYDKHHNSANEFRVYKVDGTEGFSEADVSTDGALVDLI
ncbi:discoidin domain-containing protein [Faecalibacillus intestinalis]|uniref:discoidin domain-containing protein n=1 Tax=Faecalibacillus intestinalis TaxID=1982626 RepID=UPI00399344FF